MEEEKKKSGKAGLIIAIVAIVLLVGAVVYLFFEGKSKDQVISDMTNEFEISKEEIENEYASFAVQYDEINKRISNDSLIKQLDREKQRTQDLLEELRQTKATNAARIRELKKELETVRSVMVSYVKQIDSLDRINKKLVKETAKAVKDKEESDRKLEIVTRENNENKEKLAIASQLDAVAISVVAHNKRGKDEKKSKNVTQFMVNFTIVKNITVQTGEKTVYLRIVKPNEEVLGKDVGYTCRYENVVLECSEKKIIEYTGEQQEVTMYVDVNEFLSEGTYTAYLFVEGVMIGSQSVTLN